MKGNLMAGRKYRLIDLFVIPFQICPGLTGLVLLNLLLTALLPTVQVLATARFIDTALAIFREEMDRGSIYPPLFYILMIVLYSNISWNLMRFVFDKMQMALTIEYRGAMVEKRARLAYAHVENNDTWNLITRTCKEPVERLIDGFQQTMAAVEIILRVASLLALLLAQVWWAAAVIVAVSAPLFVLAVRGGRQVYQASQESERHLRRAKYYHQVLTGRDSVEERTLFAYSDQLDIRWRDRYEQARKIVMKRDISFFTKMKLSSLLTVVVSLMILLVLLVPLSQGALTIGMFIGLVTGSLSLVQMMSYQLSSAVGNIAENREYLRDLTAFYALSEQPDALAEPEKMDDFIFESLEFRNVSFAYPGTQRHILKDLSLRMEKHRHYAIVGVNGAGKTTVTKLLTGMYSNYEGEILLNGKNLRCYSQPQLKRIFSVVFQDFAKYAISLRENVCLGDVTTQNDRRMREAVGTIGLAEMVDALPRGYDTDLGKIREGSLDISGGQWQRVAIARALYSNSAVRILDEPTAALDPVAESNVYEMFGQISAGKTTIFITHRLGAARLADEIVVIDEGRVAEQGSHEALLDRSGIYAQMFESQRSWYR